MLVSLFEDKRKTTAVMYAWLGIVMYGYAHSGAHDSLFLQIGPNDDTVIMGIHVDSWHKWSVLVAFTFTNTCIN
eukprot:2325351-Rhodomonas_salina.1